MTDRVVLTTREYATPDRLNARADMYAYRRPLLDIVAAATRLLHEVPGPVLDVGCGPGRYIAALRADRPDRPVFAADLSTGMLAAAGNPAIVADAAELPVCTGALGAVLAMHMLYHVPEPKRAVAELARVRAPGGTALIATNGSRDKQGARRLHAAVVADVSGGPVTRNFAGRYPLEVAEPMARRYFRRVERIDFEAEIVLTEPEPLLRWLGSMDGPDLTPPVLDEVRARVAATVARDGAFRFGTHTGFLVCR